MHPGITKASIISLLVVSVAVAGILPPGSVPVAYQRVQSASASSSLSAPWILSAPPQGPARAERAMFRPLAHYLTTVTGHKVIFKRPSSTLTFDYNLSRGRYAFVFEGPHLAYWMQRHVGGHPLVRLRSNVVFDTIVRSAAIKSLGALVGEPVCANPPPNLATLAFLRHYHDLLRQPYLLVISGWRQAYNGLMTGRCQATVMPARDVQRFETQTHTNVYVLYKSRAYPRSGLVASDRISLHMQDLVRTALLAPDGEKATQRLMHMEAANGWVAANHTDYAGLSGLLQNVAFLQP